MTKVQPLIKFLKGQWNVAFSHCHVLVPVLHVLRLYHNLNPVRAKALNFNHGQHSLIYVYIIFKEQISQ